MPKLRVHNFSVSIDGYAAGPSQSLDEPLGVGGEQSTTGSSALARSTRSSAKRAVMKVLMIVSPLPVRKA